MINSIEIEHNGYKASLEWRDGNDLWHPSWWVNMDHHGWLSLGQLVLEKAINKVRESWIGAPPPTDHSQIFGGYKCGVCGVGGVKLWRDYNMVLDGLTLQCRACCEKSSERQKRPDGDQIGWNVPAIPTPDGSTFWGYTSVPMAAVDWWKALPETLSGLA